MLDKSHKHESDSGQDKLPKKFRAAAFLDTEKNGACPHRAGVYKRAMDSFSKR